MKKITTNIALLAFFGCMALIGISASGKQDTTCHQEWKAGFTNNTIADKKEACEGKDEVATKKNLFFSPAGIMNFIWQ